MDVSFQPGQQVRVNHVVKEIVNGTVTGAVMQREFIGTIVNYWRNGDYIVREPVRRWPTRSWNYPR
jgi:hypothetical protein